MPTTYDITLKITYEFDTPAESNRTLLRIQPLQSGHQQLISGLLTTDPGPDDRRDGQDFFGNATVAVSHVRPASEISFRFAGRVRRDTSGGSRAASTPLSGLRSELAGLHSIAASSPHHFTGPTDRVPYSPDIAAFAGGLVQPDMPALDAIWALSSALHTTMTFDAEATDVNTAPMDAFHERRGVCQDFSHILIAALRSVGVPAGYVSGFLRTIPPEGQPRLAGADAMHAWVRAWCGSECGWIEIDPTNNLLVADDHVAVAIGRDYSDVAPVKGSHWASAGHSTKHEVDMVSFQSG